MHRKAIYAVVVVLAVSTLGLTVGAGPARADDGTDLQPSGSRRVTIELVPRTIDAKVTSAGSGIHVTPPLGGCVVNAYGAVVAYYTSGGALTATESTYNGTILCTKTAPGQSMAQLLAQSRLWIGFTNIDSGTPNGCINPQNPNCNLANSQGYHWCPGQQCAGNYWASNLSTLWLPAGWVWVTPVPSGCQLLNPQTLQCAVTSGMGYVSPVG